MLLLILSLLTVKLGYTNEWGNPKGVSKPFGRFSSSFPNYNFRSNDDGQSSNSNIKYQLSIGSGCAQLSKNIAGSLNFNYDPQTGRPVESLAIDGINIVKLSGVMCSNCYAFAGAGFLVIINYGWSAGYGAQFQVGTGASIYLFVMCCRFI